MYKFIKLQDEAQEFSPHTVEIGVDEGADAQELVEAFSYFLQASGFSNISLVIAYDEEVDQDETTQIDTELHV